jgi:plastocyanin
MQKTILWILATVIILGGWFLFSSKASAPAIPENIETPEQETAETKAREGDVVTSQTVPPDGADENVTEAVVSNVPAVVIKFTEAGYVPATVIIKKGQTMRWTNEALTKTWPASASHPTHTVYPVKSDSDCLGSSFDACKGLSQGESWDFTFDVVGDWKFHDHLNPSKWGSVTVTE